MVKIGKIFKSGNLACLQNKYFVFKPIIMQIWIIRGFETVFHSVQKKLIMPQTKCWVKNYNVYNIHIIQIYKGFYKEYIMYV